MMQRIILQPREQIRETLTRWPYELSPDQAIECAAAAVRVDNIWQVRLPVKAQEVVIRIAKVIDENG